MNFNIDIDDLTLRHYGDWGTKFKYVSYNKPYQTIDIDTGRSTYDVPLSRCKNAAQCLDWIHQLHVKTWFDEEREKEFIDMLFRLIPCELWSGA